MCVYRLLGLVGLMTTISAPCGVGKLQVVGLFKDKAIIEVDGKQRVISVGSVTPEGVMLVSATSQQAVLEIDGKRGAYTLGNRIGNRFAASQAPTSVHIWPNAEGMYTVDGSINGIAIHFLVDTGASTVAMNKREARRLGLDYAVHGTEAAVSTASGIARAFAVRLDKVRVGDIELYDIPATVIDGDFPEQALLGMSFLGRLAMLRDGRAMELRKK